MESNPGPTTREELYQQVWTTPLTQLAEQYGVPNTQLAQICDDNSIPRPPVGYWSKLKFGKAPSRPPLPPSESSAVSLEAAPISQTPKAPAPSVPRSEPAKPAAPAKLTVAPEHPLVVAARGQLSQAKVDDTGRVRSDCRTAAFIHVAPTSVERALVLWQHLIQEWTKTGGKVESAHSRKSEASFFILDKDSVPVGLVEQVGEVKGGRMPALATRSGTVVGEPNGRFSLCIQGDYGSGIRATWSDCKKFQLENRLPHIIACIREHIMHERRQRLDRECRSRQEERAKACREARDKRKQKDAARVEYLKRDLAAWHEAERIRSFAGAVRAALEKDTLRVQDKGAARAWLDWAFWHADVIDPLVDAGPCPDHSVQPQNVVAADFDLTHRTREVVEMMGVKDADELLRVSEEDIRRTLHYHDGHIWSEITRLLEGLGYDVSNRSFWNWSSRSQQQHSLADSLSVID